MPRQARVVARILVVAASALAALAGRAGTDETAERVKALKEAFKPLKLPAAAKLEKEVAPVLPPGIVIESQPFHAVIERFAKPLEEHLGRREAALKALGATTSRAEADVVKAGWKSVESECSELVERVGAVEERYGEVYNQAWEASGEGDRQTRKLAAVLIPLYRRLLEREAAVASRAAEALGGLEDAGSLAWLAALAVDPSPSLRAVAVEALGRVGGAEALATVRKVAADDAESAVRLRALNALGSWKVSEGKDAVVAALADPAWEVRAFAVAVCVRARLLDAVPAMIRALEKEDGRLRQDLDDGLYALVGVRMYGDAALWASWWKENEEKTLQEARNLASGGAYDKALGPSEAWDDAAAPAEGDAKERDPAEERGTTADFYGIRTLSKRVLFVVDISKSMENPAEAKPKAQGGEKDPYAEPRGSTKIAIAKWQLHRAVAALPADATFDLIVYSESYRVWQPQMAEATAKTKAKAHEWIDGIAVNGTTNIADSLDRAFALAGVAPLILRTKTPRTALAADTIYLLSDGDPNRGRVTDLTALLEEVVRRNRSTRLVIHAIGIGEVAGSAFLESLAKRNGGQYVGFR